MTQQLQQTLRDSKAARWTALVIVSFTMMWGYFLTDAMSPLMTMLEVEMNWSSSDFGIFNWSYCWFNVFLFMLIFGGIILDKLGVRFTGLMTCALMVIGAFIKYYSVEYISPGPEAGTIFGIRTQVIMASLGYAIFAVGTENCGITVTKVIAKWFRGKEMATAMGVQVALARIGSQAAFSFAIPLAESFSISTPVLLGLFLLLAGMVAYFIFSIMDKKLDTQIHDAPSDSDDEEKFSVKDVKDILVSPGFWLIALLCVLFYSCVFPFQKFASELMISKYGIDAAFAGTIAGLPALGALVLTPIFGGVVDKRGKGASIMILGAAMLIGVHFVYSLPFLTDWLVAVVLMVILGIAFSLVPSAMWPAVAKVFPAHQLGTAYALIFLIQNVGLWGVPTLIGWVLEAYCIVSGADGGNTYDYTLPMCIFTGLAVLSMLVAFALKMVDKKKGYGLEEPNIK